MEERNEIFSFETLDHKHYSRSVDFYWTIGIFGVIFSIFSFIFLKNVLFGILILFCVFLYGYVSSKVPRSIKVVFTNKDIMVDDKIIEYKKIKSFRILNVKHHNEIVLYLDRTYRPVVSFSLPQENNIEIKEFLKQHTEENNEILPDIGKRMMIRYDL